MIWPHKPFAACIAEGKADITLRAEDGLTSREVADYLGISIHTVQSQYWKATEAIRACAHPRGDTETGS